MVAPVLCARFFGLDALVPLLEGLRCMLVSAHRPLGFGREVASGRFRRVCAFPTFERLKRWKSAHSAKNRDPKSAGQSQYGFMPRFYAELNVAGSRAERCGEIGGLSASKIFRIMQKSL
ncbi:hypothetical protein COLSTE_00287 [Collinsella stercoris DSM 13279]|uniref:Uncharacterized protein n=1 Tax=Collinsella stercoris DSM 13279 TaxID=445975 RepID=B6G897_9ACTN|nr:hypothetical protein COLSTE_00287 [Collinsella stercoris DSM 13279]